MRALAAEVSRRGGVGRAPRAVLPLGSGMTLRKVLNPSEHQLPTLLKRDGKCCPAWLQLLRQSLAIVSVSTPDRVGDGLGMRKKSRKPGDKAPSDFLRHGLGTLALHGPLCKVGGSY